MNRSRVIIIYLFAVLICVCIALYCIFDNQRQQQLSSKREKEYQNQIVELESEKNQLLEDLENWKTNRPSQATYTRGIYNGASFGVYSPLIPRDIEVDETQIVQRGIQSIDRSVGLNKSNGVARISINAQEFVNTTEAELPSATLYSCYEGSCDTTTIAQHFSLAQSKRRIPTGEVGFFQEFDPHFYDLTIARIRYITTSPSTSNPVVVTISVIDNQVTVSPNGMQKFSPQERQRALSDLDAFVQSIGKITSDTQ